MFEHVNRFHADKLADRIAGAMVDLAYSKQENPKVAVEVLIGHNKCHIIAESSYKFTYDEVQEIVNRIADVECKIDLVVVPQDEHLSENQEGQPKAGDNGIFKGVPITDEEQYLANLSKIFEDKFASDGKYIINNNTLTICQSNATDSEINQFLTNNNFYYVINPLGYWTGGTNVDTGATNRKLGSDMGYAVTGGGLHGKDLTKADVCVNVMCHILANQKDMEVSASCSIGDRYIIFNFENGEFITIEYSEIMKEAKRYIDYIGGFEKFACSGFFQ